MIESDSACAYIPVNTRWLGKLHLQQCFISIQLVSTSFSVYCYICTTFFQYIILCTWIIISFPPHSSSMAEWANEQGFFPVHIFPSCLQHKAPTCCDSQENCISIYPKGFFFFPLLGRVYEERQEFFLKKKHKARVKTDRLGHGTDQRNQAVTMFTQTCLSDIKFNSVNHIFNLYLLYTKFRAPWYILTELQMENISSPWSYRAARQHNQPWSSSSIKHILQFYQTLDYSFFGGMWLPPVAILNK